MKASFGRDSFWLLCIGFDGLKQRVGKEESGPYPPLCKRGVRGDFSDAPSKASE